MRTLNRRLLKLETALARLVPQTPDWGGMARMRDSLLKNAEKQSAEAAAELRTELDSIGPLGLWTELVRSLLKDRGFVQTATESFAETLQRFLGIDGEELRSQMTDGSFKDTVCKRLEEMPLLSETRCEQLVAH